MTLQKTQAGQRDSGQSLFGQSSMRFFFVVQKIGMVFSNSVSRNLLFLFMFFGLSNLPLCNFSAFSIFLGGESSILEPPNTFSDLSEGQPLIPREKPKRN